MSRLALPTQRRLASGAFLLASFLEICGCNPVRTCEQLRLTRLSAMPLDTLFEQCAPCLSVHEMAGLRDAVAGSTSVEGQWDDVQTVGDAVSQMHGPSFTSYSEASLTSGDGMSRRNAVLPDATTGAGSQEIRPIAWPIPESVLFLYDRAPNISVPARRLGTGFILSAGEAQLRQPALFLVTARHVVDPEWASCDARNPESLTVRFNRKGGGVGYATVRLKADGERHLLIPGDDSTDIALLPLTPETVPDLAQYKLKELGVERLPTSAELGELGNEQRIVTAGVSLSKTSALMDFPVSSPGVMKIAASRMPLRVKCVAESPAKPLQLWMIHAAISEGVAGSPVYAAIARGPRQERTPVLVGIQSVVWPEEGVAGITPVTALEEVVQRAMHRDDMALGVMRRPPR